MCTPDESHYEVLIEILHSSNPPAIVFLEKPALTSRDEFNTINALATKLGTQIIVNHSRRFDERYETLQKIIQEGSFGQCLRVDCWYYGGWLHNGIHIIDTLNFIFIDRVQTENLTKLKAMNLENI